MVEEVRHIQYRTALPEQYYLANRMAGWRHLDTSWNMEVGQLYDDPGFTWPRVAARKAAAAPRCQAWFDQAIDEVRVFHFSGNKLHPWWYIDLSPQEAFDEASLHWKHRDPRKLVAAALWEWRSAYEEVQEDLASWPSKDRRSAKACMDRLHERASQQRQWCSRYSVRQLWCSRCGGWYAESQGRWLLGWEGWWLCFDCIVDYVFTDEEPEALCCTVCGASGQGCWRWKTGVPRWHCWQCDACPIEGS